MVSSTMQVESRLQMPPAAHGQGVSLDDSVLITILKTDGDPRIIQGGNPSGEPMEMAGVGPYVAAAVSSGKATVIIKADRDIPSGFVEEVARAANESAPADAALTFFVGVTDKPQRN
jgi:biopolymer transport protein ExbD/biopolymer transport protein TolR